MLSTLTLSPLEPAVEQSAQSLPGPNDPRSRAASAVVVGAGNIGEAKNIATQNFRPEDVGRSKAVVLAQRLRADFPQLAIRAYAQDLEDLPVGVANVNLLLGALDSRQARQTLVSNLGWPLGVPVVDGGVGEGLVGRVQVFVPGAATACLECTWGQEDYRLLANETPCEPGASATAPPTVSPAFAGALVAGLMTAEAIRILSGQRPAESQEIAFDLMHRRFLTSRLRRAPRCRFDHEVVQRRVRLSSNGQPATVGELLAVVTDQFGDAAVHLEWRRGLATSGFTRQRHQTPQSLRPRAAEPLTALGLGEGDWIRIRSESGSLFVILD